MLSFFEFFSFCLLLIHFAVPFTYFLYLYAKFYKKPWNIKFDRNYKPYVTIIVPTYNEASFIEAKLSNIREQSYPKDLLEIIIADSSSVDGTPDIAEEWCNRNSGIKCKVLRRLERGKIKAILKSINVACGEIAIVSDADSLMDKTAIEECVKYFADPSVGVVTASLDYYGDKYKEEKTYRSFYNIVRVAESKLHSTPIHSGVFQAFRRTLLLKIPLLSFKWIEDCSLASFIAFMGYRAIQVDDVRAYESTRGRLWKMKLRRAQHNLLNFRNTKRYSKKLDLYSNSLFDHVWCLESFLYLVNPWILISGLTLMVVGVFYGSTISGAILILGLLLAFFRPYRTWLLQQVYLITASLRNLLAKQVTWEK